MSVRIVMRRILWPVDFMQHGRRGPALPRRKFLMDLHVFRNTPSPLMTRALDTTLHVLATTRNEAAASVLVSALDAANEGVRLGALNALLARRSPGGHRALIARWHTLPSGWKSLIVDKPGQLTGAIRDALLAAGEQLSANGCDAALAMAEYDLIPVLIQVAEADTGARGDLAAHTLRELAEQLYRELSAQHRLPRDWRQRRDPQLFRAHVVSALELSVGRFIQHGRREILEAFLMLATRDNATLRRVLLDPLDRAHVPFTELMTYSPRPSVARLVLSFVDDARAPGAALHVVAHRDDDVFLRRLMQKLGDEPGSGARINLRKIKRIVWLQQNLTRLLELDEAGQQAAVSVAVCSGLARLEKFEVLKLLLNEGQPAGRRAAAAALVDFQGVDANRLVLAALRDDDARVQASALGQLRDRGLPGAMAALVEALDSPEDIVRETARRCLREFNFSRFLAAFDGLDEQVRRNTGRLVRKVDLTTPQRLAEEMNAAARSRRLRAIEMTVTLDMADELEAELIELLDDDDHLVRMEAAMALADCPSDNSRLALRDALLDRSVSVQNAAERALGAMATFQPRRSGKIDVAALSLPDEGLLSTGGGRRWT